MAYYQYWKYEYEEATDVSGDGNGIERDTSHVASDVLAPIVDSGVEQSQECGLQKPASANRHRLNILGGDAEFDIVEVSDIFEETTAVGDNLSQALSLDTVKT